MLVTTPNLGSVNVPQSEIDAIAQASTRLANGGRGMSTHEFTAAAIVNGRVDLLGEDFRASLIRMQLPWALGTVLVMYDHWHREMTLRTTDPNCPVGDQRIITNTGRYRNGIMLKRR